MSVSYDGHGVVLEAGTFSIAAYRSWVWSWRPVIDDEFGSAWFLGWVQIMWSTPKC